MDSEDDSQREAGAYHKSQNCATTLRNTFLQKKYLRAIYLRIYIVLEI